MASVNKVILIGNLGADPEKRYTKNEVAVATLSVATKDFIGKGDDRKETTEWHRVVCWHNTAENAAKYLSKGRQVYIEGKLQTRSWEDKEGQKRYTTEIVAQVVQFLGSEGHRGEGHKPKFPTDEDHNRAAMNATIPAQKKQTLADQQFNDSAPVPADAPDLDEIPF